MWVHTMYQHILSVQDSGYSYFALLVCAVKYLLRTERCLLINLGSDITESLLGCSHAPYPPAFINLQHYKAGSAPAWAAGHVIRYSMYSEGLPATFPKWINAVTGTPIRVRTAQTGKQQTYTITTHKLRVFAFVFALLFKCNDIVTYLNRLICNCIYVCFYFSCVSGDLNLHYPFFPIYFQQKTERQYSTTYKHTAWHPLKVLLEFLPIVSMSYECKMTHVKWLCFVIVGITVTSQG